MNFWSLVKKQHHFKEEYYHNKSRGECVMPSPRFMLLEA